MRWVEQQKLFVNDTRGFGFGSSVAVEGNTAIVGSPLGNLDLPGGIVHVYTREGNSWIQQTNLNPGPLLGGSVALSGEGLIAGSGGVDSSFGHFYIYSRHDSVWQEQLGIESPTPSLLGSTVAISGDIAVVGSPADEGEPQGRVYVYARRGGIWMEEAVLNPPSTNASARTFGSGVSIQGSTILVAGWNDPSFYLYSRRNSSWFLEETVTDTSRQYNEFTGRFPVAFSGDTILIRAMGVDGVAGFDIYRITSGITLVISKTTDSLLLAIHDATDKPVAIETAPSLTGPWTQIRELTPTTSPETLTLPFDPLEETRFFRARELDQSSD